MLASATTLWIWPGSAPCNTTLMACIAASSNGDTVAIRSDAVIDEDVFYDKAVDLVAGSEFRPRLAEGRSIRVQVQAPPGWSLRLSGITVLGGNVQVAGYSAGSVRIDRMNVLRVETGYGINVYGTSFDQPFTLTSVVTDCRVGVAGPFATGIAVNANTDVSVDTTISDNRITAVGATVTTTQGQRSGIYTAATDGSALRADIVRNRVLADPVSVNPAARLSFGIRAIGSGAGGSTAVRVADNVVVLRDDDAILAAGVYLAANGPQNALRVVNNSLIGGDFGVRLFTSGSTTPIDAVIANNLIAWHSVTGYYGAGFSGSLVNAYNAYFGNGSDFETGGPGNLQIDPKVMKPERPRLAGDSPLINSADPAYRLGGFAGLAELPDLDADGLRRRKGSGLDIGAWEYGDETLVSNVGVFAPTSAVEDPRSNGQGGLLMQVSRSGGAQPTDTTPNPRPLSQRYDTASQRWQVLADDGFNLNIGSGFHLFAPMIGTTVLQHTANAGNISGASSLLPAAISTLPGDSIVLITPTRGAAGTGVADPHPIASRWLGGAWYVVNVDGAAMPAGASFTVYAQAPSRNAYLHTMDAADSSVLQHPELDGNPCAAPHVANSAFGAANPHPLGVHYDAAIGRWRLRNEDGAAFASLSRALVVFEPKRSETLCNDAMFGDGFEQVN